MKLQELLAFVGGILKICTTAGILITHFFDKFVFFEKMVNLYFQLNIKDGYKFEETEQKLNKNNMDSISKNVLNNIQENNFVRQRERRLDDNENNFEKIIKKETYIKSANLKNIVNKDIKNTFEITYMDILGMTLCFFNKKYSFKSKMIKVLDKKMNLFTDMTEIINTVIKNKHNDDGKSFHENKNIMNIENESQEIK